MPGPLKNARHERFAQELAKGSTSDAAYIAAGFKANRGNATRLKANESVFDRVQEIKGVTAEKVIEKTGIDAAWVLTKAAELHAKALEEKQLSVAKGALDLIGKHVDVQAFREQMQFSGLIEYKNLSDEEILARIAAHEAERAEQPTTH
jgi:adenosyl cobinamide kinase/adenosyl cobinamide phosphate guanylyltransferase